MRYLVLVLALLTFACSGAAPISGAEAPTQTPPADDAGATPTPSPDAAPSAGDDAAPTDDASPLAEDAAPVLEGDAGDAGEAPDAVATVDAGPAPVMEAGPPQSYADCTPQMIQLLECPFSPPGLEVFDDAGAPVTVCHTVSGAQANTLLYTDGFAEMPASMSCTAGGQPTGYLRCCSRVWPADGGL